jgi:hypothetical protein
MIPKRLVIPERWTRLPSATKKCGATETEKEKGKDKSYSYNLPFLGFIDITLHSNCYTKLIVDNLKKRLRQ